MKKEKDVRRLLPRTVITRHRRWRAARCLRDRRLPTSHREADIPLLQGVLDVLNHELMMENVDFGFQVVDSASMYNFV